MQEGNAPTDSVRTRPAARSVSTFWKVVVLVAAVAIGAHASWYHRETHYFCEACNSRRVEEMTRLLGWQGFRVPGTRDIDEVGRSHAMRDLFASDHRHEWRLLPSPVMREGIRSVTQHSIERPSSLHLAYEADAELRAYLLKRVRTGEVSREDLARLFTAAGRYGTGLSQADRAARESAERIRPFLLEFQRVTGTPLGLRFVDG